MYSGAWALRRQAEQHWVTHACDVEDQTLSYLREVELYYSANFPRCSFFIKRATLDINTVDQLFTRNLFLAQQLHAFNDALQPAFHLLNRMRSYLPFI
jgi:hypothetical protein